MRVGTKKSYTDQHGVMWQSTIHKPKQSQQGLDASMPHRFADINSAAFLVRWSGSSRQREGILVVLLADSYVSARGALGKPVGASISAKYLAAHACLTTLRTLGPRRLSVTRCGAICDRELQCRRSGRAMIGHQRRLCRHTLSSKVMYSSRHIRHRRSG